MKHWITAAIAALGSICIAAAANADDEASNRPTVIASQFGNCYAKSVPSTSYGNDGQTRVYLVGAKSDQLIATYDWFAHTIRLECNVADATGITGHSIVQFGPWARGQTAKKDTLAIAFYWNGKLLRRYSTLDIAGRPDNVRMSTSHYSVIKDIVGYNWVSGNRYSFTVRTHDNRVIMFDPGTGAILPSSPSRSP